MGSQTSRRQKFTLVITLIGLVELVQDGLSTLNIPAHPNSNTRFSIIAFLLASRKTAIDARKTFMRIAPILRNPISDLVVLLESELSGVPMEFEGNIIIDQPCQTNVWIRGTW